MISQSKNRVQAIKSKFENLSNDTESLVTRKKSINAPEKQLCKLKQGPVDIFLHKNESTVNNNKENSSQNTLAAVNKQQNSSELESDSSNEEFLTKPNSSYLYSKSDIKRSLSESKTSLSRQPSDPSKKLHRSHAFRCDRSQKICDSPTRHGSCNYGRPETGEVTLEMGERKLSKDRLKRLGNLLEDQMRKENFIPQNFTEKCTEAVDDKMSETSTPYRSIPDEDVPQHILDQYAKVMKQKKAEDSPSDSKHDTMTDSGVSSETENLEEDNRLQKIKQFEEDYFQDKIDKPINSNLLDILDNKLGASSETMKLEKKNPHLKLTDTLKKALKQPLPPGPPPKKPPRTFATSPIPESPEKNTTPVKKDTKQMLEKLEKVLQKHENQKTKNIYDIAETNLCENAIPFRDTDKPKEVHYLCTEILDITHRNLLPSQNNSTDVLKNCFNSLNCAITNQSTLSLPYTRLSTGSLTNNRNSMHICLSASTDSLDLDNRTRLSTFFKDDNNFKCHLNSKPKERNSEFFLPEKEHIYDVPFGVKPDNSDVNNFVANCDSVNVKTMLRRLESESLSEYGVVNSGTLNRIQSRSLEELRLKKNEDQKIYDIPCDTSRAASPEAEVSVTKRTDFQRLLSNFESGNLKDSADFGIKNFDNATRTKDKMAEHRDLFIMAAEKMAPEKPLPIKPKPLLLKIQSDSKIKSSKSTENLNEEFRLAKRSLEKKFSTESKRFKKFERNASQLSTNLSLSIVRKERKDQLDVDRENLNRLMSEIYETVTAACKMEEQQRPTRFPTDADHANSEDSVKLTRSLTEKRKNYVRRVSSRAAYLDPKLTKTRYRHQTSICSVKSEIIDNPYSTFRSWKSFRCSQNNINKMADSLIDKMADSDSTDSKFNLTDSSGNVLSMKDDLNVSMDNLSIDDKAGCLDIDLPFVPRERGLFNVCLLVGLNYMTGQAYVKSVFPNQVTVPPHIENLVFPETISLESENAKTEYELTASKTQTYSLVLTDEKGERNYGYCRRVLPEGASCCLPLCYCIIGRYRAPGFYYKVLKEIESHHGSSEIEINTILQQLFDSDFPNPGEDITLTLDPVSHHQDLRSTTFRNSLNLGDLVKSKTLPDSRKSDHINTSSEKNAVLTVTVPDYYDLESNNNNSGTRKVMLSVQSGRTKVILRPLEPRVDEDNLSVLLDCLGAGLLIKVFGSMLLERKVVLISDNLRQLSGCMEALQSVLYPFVWQQPLISTVPRELRREVLEAPLPILAGCLRAGGARGEDAGVAFEEGMLIDVSNQTPKVIFYQGDESTILPTSSYKTLKTTLQMEMTKNQKADREDGKTRNVLISEAFLRFFVDILGDFWQHFSVGELKDGDLGKGNVVFNKEAFVKGATSKQNQYFLEWFTETAIFNHFIQNMAASYHRRKQMAPQPVDYSTIDDLVDAPLPNYYELFDERVTRNGGKSSHKSLDGGVKTNYKSAMNKKVKLLKSRLKDLVT